MRAVFPKTKMEMSDAFEARAHGGRPFVHDQVVFADRAAAMRGDQFTQTMRTASCVVLLLSSPLGAQRLTFAVPAHPQRGFPASVVAVLVVAHPPAVARPRRRNARSRPCTCDDSLEARHHLQSAHRLRLVGHPYSRLTLFLLPDSLTVSRQNWNRRKLVPADHDALVATLTAASESEGWEFTVADMETMPKDEQVRLAARTTIMMGVHGNGKSAFPLDRLLFLTTRAC